MLAPRAENYPTRDHRLSSAQVAQFYGLGWVVQEEVFSSAEIRRIKQAFWGLQRIAAPFKSDTEVQNARIVYSETGKLHRIVWCGALEPSLLDISEDPRILQPTAQLLGNHELIQIINQAHFKLPGDKVSFSYHQDSWNRRYGTPLFTDVNGKGSYVQCVLTVDEMTEKNGPLCFVPNSGSLGHLGAPGEDRDQKLIIQLQKAPPVPISAPAGSLIFFGPFAIHGSPANESSSPRRILINGFTLPGANRRNYPGSGLGVKRSLIDT